MQIENNNYNYISNLPNELRDILFFNYMDSKSRFNCTYLDKMIHEFFFDSLIFKLKLPINSNLTNYSQVIKHYKLHCKFFFQNLPESFPDRTKYTSVVNTKMYVDRVLGMPYDPDKGSGSILEEAWHCFSETLPFIDFERETAFEQVGHTYVYKNHFPKRGTRTKVKMIFNEFISANTNQEIQIFLAAGVRFLSRGSHHAHIISGLIKTDWCTLETIKMLVECKFKISRTSIFAAIQSKRYEPILVDLLKALEEESLFWLCNDLPVESRYLIENDEYLGGISEVSCYTIGVAMEKLYSEKFILKILVKCKKIEDDFILRFALKNYSENVILPMLSKCDELVYQDFIQMGAIRRKHSEIVLEKIVDKSSNVRYQIIELAEQQGTYSGSLLEKMKKKST